MEFMLCYMQLLVCLLSQSQFHNALDFAFSEVLSSRSEKFDEIVIVSVRNRVFEKKMFETYKITSETTEHVY